MLYNTNNETSEVPQESLINLGKHRWILFAWIFFSRSFLKRGKKRKRAFNRGKR